MGFTDRVYDYMARANLMLSKPGGITLFETIFSELPILAWEPFLQQERNNARFITRYQIGRIAAKEPEACVEAIRRLLYDDKALRRMGQNMRLLKEMCIRDRLWLVPPAAFGRRQPTRRRVKIIPSCKRSVPMEAYLQGLTMGLAYVCLLYTSRCV